MTRTRAEVYLLGATVIWSGTFAIVKEALSYSSPLLFVGLRFMLAAVVLGLLFWKTIRTIDRQALIDGSVLGLLLGIGFAGQTIGLEYTLATKSGFITGMTVIFTPAFQMAIEQRAPRGANLVGVALVVGGLYFLTSPSGQQFNLGDGLTLGAAVVFGLYMVVLDVYSKRNNTIHLVFVQIAVTALLSLGGSAAGETMFFVPTTGLLGTFAYTAILATLLTTWVQTRYQQYTTPTRAALIFSLEPALAALISWWLLGEVVGSLGILGGGLIVGGILVSELSK